MRCTFLVLRMQAFVRFSTLPCRRCRTISTCRLEGLGLGFRPSRPSIVRAFTQTQTYHRPRPTSPGESYTRRTDGVSTPDTIYALSTATGRAAIAVIRISGPACLDIYGRLCPDAAFPVPRVAVLRKLRDPEDNARVLDPGALVLYFPAPATVTGEDVLELHCHGGVAIVRSVLGAIARCRKASTGRKRRKLGEDSSIRAAEAGEFTKRAFYNGVMDLLTAEGLGEALSAETEMQRRLAVDGQSGGLAGRYEEWRTLLLEARGEMEALIDFSEDQHFDESPRELVQSVAKQVLGLKVLIERHVLNARKGELLREGVSVALLGAPNAGKSSLLNLIVGREAAIVSAEAGTTRDIVDVSVDLNGWLVRLGDMAGLRGLATSGKEPLSELNEALRRKERNTLGLKEEATSIGVVEREGIRRARTRALESDVVIMLLPVYVDSAGAPAIDLATELVDAVRECQEAGKEILFVLNKIDLILDDQATVAIESLKDVVKDVFPNARDEEIVSISCRNASTSSSTDPGNIQHLLRTLTSLFADMTSAAGPSVPGMQQSQAYWQSSLSISHRQSQYLLECLTHLDNFLEMSAPPSAQAQGGHFYDNHADIVGEKSDHGTWVSTETMLDHQPYYSTYSRYPISDSDLDIVLLAEHLRAAAMCLAKITGRGEGGDVEDVLGVVFEKFCVGK